VTRTELDDILKLLYYKEFANRDLLPIIKKFSSIQNKILIDYKAFRDWIKQGLKKAGFYEAQLQKRANKEGTKFNPLAQSQIQEKIKVL